MQDLDHADETASFEVVTKRQPTTEAEYLVFAWKDCKTVKSNAILAAKIKLELADRPAKPPLTLLACEQAEAAC